MTKRHTSSGDCFGNCAAFEAYDILEVRGEGLASWTKEGQRDKTLSRAAAQINSRCLRSVE